MKSQRFIALAVFLLLTITGIYGQSPAGNHYEIQFNNNNSFGASPLLKWNGAGLSFYETGQTSASLYFQSESGDDSWIFSENWGENKNRLVFLTQDDGNDDYAVFRNMHWSAGNKDVFEVHRDWTMANSNFYVMNGNVGIGTMSPKRQVTLGGLQPVLGMEHSDQKGWSTYLTGFGNFSIHEYINSDWTAGMDRLTIKRGGNVGIGTSSPDYLFQIHSDNAPTLAIGKLNTVTNGRSSLIFFAGSLGYTNSFKLEYKKSSTEDRLAFIDGGLVERVSILNSGNVGIGTTSPDSKLTVKGTVHAEEVKVDLSVPGPDYVFSSNYPLRSLEETQAYILKNKHLPEIPSAAEMEANGIELGEMNMLLLRKIEELTLHVIDLNKQIAALDDRLSREVPAQTGKKIEELRLYQIEQEKQQVKKNDEQDKLIDHLLNKLSYEK